MRCPICGAVFHNAVKKALRDVSVYEGLVITDVDYVIEVGNEITCIIEEKHLTIHRVPTYQLITLKRITRRLDVPLLVTFIDDEIEEVTVYEAPTDIKYPSSKYFDLSRYDPVFVGGFDEFREFMLYEVILR